MIKYLYPASIIILCLLTATGCSSKKPILYPNAAFHKASGETPEQAIANCVQLAKDSGTHSSRMSETSQRAAASTATGAASGAVIGAISGGAGRGAAMGAVGGLTAGLLHTLFSASEPDPVHKRFVEQCLRDKGYQPIGWQ